MAVLEYQFIDAGLPKGPIGQVRRMLRRYRGVLDHTNRIQETFYWCGPTTAQMILQAAGVSVTQQQMAAALGTTVNGTNYVGLFPPVLNGRLPGAGYSAVDRPVREVLWDLVTGSIDAGLGVAANIVATKGVDAPSFYPSGDTYHYVPIFGYRGEGANRELFCADSANFQSVTQWWAPLDQWVSLLSNKGVAPAARKDAFTNFTDAEIALLLGAAHQVGDPQIGNMS